MPKKKKRSVSDAIKDATASIDKFGKSLDSAAKRRKERKLSVEARKVPKPYDTSNTRKSVGRAIDRVTGSGLSKNERNRILESAREKFIGGPKPPKSSAKPGKKYESNYLHRTGKKIKTFKPKDKPGDAKYWRGKPSWFGE